MPTSPSVQQLQKQVQQLEEENRRLAGQEIRLKRELERHQAVAGVAAALAATRSFEEISRVVYQKALTLTRSGYGFVGYLNSTDNFLVCPTMDEAVWRQCRVADKSLEFNAFKGLWGWVLVNGAPLVTNRTPADPRFGGLPEGHVPIQRFLGAPAVVEGRVFGIIAVANASRDYQEEDQAFLMQLANLYGLTIQRMQAEEALAASEKWNRTLFEKVPIGLVMSDAQGSILDVNPAWQRLLGYSREECRTLNVETVYASPADRARNIADLQEAQILRGREVRLQRKGGGAFQGRVNSDILRINGQDVFISSLEDITREKSARQALKQSEEIFRLISGLTSDFIYKVQLEENGHLRVEFVTEGVAHITGYHPKEVQLCATWPHIVHPEDLDRFFAFMRDIGAGDKRHVEIRIYDKYHRMKWLELWGRPEWNPAGSGVTAIFGAGKDITRQKFTQQALCESEERYRLITENSYDMIAELDGEGRFQYANSRHEAELGYTPEELAYTGIFDHIHPSDRRLFQMQFEQSRRTRGLFPHTLLMFRGKGDRWLWLEACGNTYVRTDGQTRTVLVCRNITERMRVAGELKKSREFLNCIINALDEPLVVKDETHRWVLVNDTTCRIIGLPREKLIGKNASHYFPPAQVNRFWRADQEVLKTGEPHVSEERIDLDGKTHDILVKKTLFHEESENRRYFVLTIRDITEQKAAEEKLKAVKSHLEQLLRLSRSVLYSCNPCDRFRFTFASENLRQEFGYEPRDLIHSPGFWRQRIHPEDRGQVECYLANLAHMNSLSHSLEYRLRHQDGSYRWVRDDFNIVCDANGNRLEIVGNIIDISKSRFMELQLRNAQKMEALGTLSGGIAHDFNNILGAIIGFTETAKAFEIEKTSPAQETMSEVLRASHRARELIRQILTFSRREKEVQEPVAVRSVIQEGIKMLRASLPSNIEIVRELEAEPGIIKGDPTQIHQILINVCTNAAHAMPEGGGLKVRLGRVTVDGESAEVFEVDPGEYVKLSVEDNGTGMDPEILAKIFDPFFTTKKPGEGSGMGLAVVHGIVKRHGGGVYVESTPGRGSAFHMVFPRIEGEVRSAGANTPDISRGKGNILFVDDDALVCHMGRKMLQGLGYEVESASSGHEALAALESGKYDLVISDIMMPRMTGIQLANEIGRTSPHLPIILCTGYWENSQLEIRPPGVRAVISKPFTTGDIARIIRDTFAF